MTDLTERTLEAVEREIERAKAAGDEQWLTTLRERHAELLSAIRASMPTLPPTEEKK